MAWNKKFHIGIFCDPTKAFDCVNHDVLTAKFEHYGIQESTLNWFKSYLSNRRQRTKLSINKDQMYYSTWEIGARSNTRLCVRSTTFYYINIHILMIYQ